MAARIAVIKEITPGEKRTALVPEVVKRYKQLGAEIVIETGAGVASFFPDALYGDVQTRPSAADAVRDANIVLKVQGPTEDEIRALPEGAIVVGFLAPGRNLERAKLLAQRKVTSFSVELVPRTTRAQSMDALSSQASVAGYQAVLMAAHRCAKFFPMLTTAAGTIRPAKVLVIGAGVAGLQAIATARRLGAIVEAYDVRSAVKEQIESLGARFVMAVQGAEGTGGYARELTEEEKRQQAEVLAKHVAGADAVICTAGVPGRPAPKIITKAMVEGMRPGSVVLDLMAEGGGNCEFTQTGQDVMAQGVRIYGPVQVPSMSPVHASEMYAKNLLAFLQLIVDKGEVKLDWNDDILAGSVYTHAGEVKHEPTRKALEAEGFVLTSPGA